MHIINMSCLEAYLKANSDHERGLQLWFKVVSVGYWQDFDDLCQAFPDAQKTGRFVTFQTNKGDCLVETWVDFKYQKIYVRKVYGRADYGS
ncbi:MAG: type II toxin-antitoxin system HigB family toxin [Cyanobacteria bacterium P01_H01_bin.26]